MNPAAPKIRAASATAERFSTLPWPYGCSASAGASETRTEKNATAEATRSTVEWIASEKRLTEPVARPAISLKRTSATFETTASRAAFAFSTPNVGLFAASRARRRASPPTVRPPIGPSTLTPRRLQPVVHAGSLPIPTNPASRAHITAQRPRLQPPMEGYPPLMAEKTLGRKRHGKIRSRSGLWHRVRPRAPRGRGRRPRGGHRRRRLPGRRHRSTPPRLKSSPRAGLGAAEPA